MANYHIQLTASWIFYKKNQMSPYFGDQGHSIICALSTNPLILNMTIMHMFSNSQ